MVEFIAIIGFLLYCPLVLPYIPSDLPSLYGEVLGLGKKDVATILFGDEVDFMAIISYLQKNNCTLNSLFRRRATVLCILGAFLFLDGSSKRDLAMLLSIV